MIHFYKRFKINKMPRKTVVAPRTHRWRKQKAKEEAQALEKPWKVLGELSSAPGELAEKSKGRKREREEEDEKLRES